MGVVAQVVCNAKTGSFVDPGKRIYCDAYDSTCGNIEDEFDLDERITFTCSQGHIFDTCSLTCPSGLIPSPIDEIKCNLNSELFLDSGTEVNCIEPPETECGYLADSFTIGETVIPNCNSATGV